MHADRTVPTRPGRIVLTGFMGAGKSTVGRLLARRLGWRFLDADSLLEFSAGKTIAELFLEFGEPRFREMEAELIAGLSGETDLVLALGGGALESEATRANLLSSPNTQLVFLEAPLDELLRRCAGHGSPDLRPVLRDRDAVLSRFEKRLPQYRQAHLTVPTASQTPEEVVTTILEKLRLTTLAAGAIR